MWNFVRIAMGGGEGGEGVVHLPVARKGLLRMIEAVAMQGEGNHRRAEAWDGGVDGPSGQEREEIRREIHEQGQGRSDSPLIISLAPEKPDYLIDEKSMAWRAWVWIRRRGKGDYRTMS